MSQTSDFASSPKQEASDSDYGWNADVMDGPYLVRSAASNGRLPSWAAPATPLGLGPSGKRIRRRPAGLALAGSSALATGSLHPFSPSPPTGRPRPAAPVAVSLRTPALPPRERTLDCASQRLRHPPRQILSNQPIDPPRPPPVVRACRLCCSCGFQFRSLFVPTDCFPL
jgi:hypothetical protein